jgi:two-component system, NtrC family, nitrogen regulation response regulator NtrX
VKTILLADDSRNIREYCRAVLEDDGYRVVLTRDGVEALAVFGKTMPDLVILDIWMPRMNGLETLERIAALAPQLPVILFTSCDEDCLADERSRWALACLEKGADLSELRRTIRRVLATGLAEPRSARQRLGLPPEHASTGGGAGEKPVVAVFGSG